MPLVKLVIIVFILIKYRTIIFPIQNELYVNLKCSLCSKSYMLLCVNEYIYPMYLFQPISSTYLRIVLVIAPSHAEGQYTNAPCQPVSFVGTMPIYLCVLSKTSIPWNRPQCRD